MADDHLSEVKTLLELWLAQFASLGESQIQLYLNSGF